MFDSELIVQLFNLEYAILQSYLDGTLLAYQSEANNLLDAIFSTIDVDYINQRFMIHFLLRLNLVDIDIDNYFSECYLLDENDGFRSSCRYEINAHKYLLENNFKDAYYAKESSFNCLLYGLLENKNSYNIMLYYNLLDLELYAKSASNLSEYRTKYETLLEKLKNQINKNPHKKELESVGELLKVYNEIEEKYISVYYDSSYKSTEENIKKCDTYIEKLNKLQFPYDEIREKFIKIRCNLISRLYRSKASNISKYDISKYTIKDERYNEIINLLKTDKTLKEDLKSVYHLFTLAFYTEKILNELEVLDVNNEDRKIAYYTKLSTFQYLLEDDKNQLTVMHSQYMNDPNEGKVFMNYVYGQNSAKKADRDYFDDEFVFLKSFTNRVDKLSMWSLYGDDTKGCCIVLDNNMFDNLESKLLLLRRNSIISESLYNIWKGCNLYQVAYFDGEDFWVDCKENDNVKTYCKRIKACVTKLKGILTNDVYTNLCNKLMSRIKYLIKYDDYRDEQETRIITQCKSLTDMYEVRIIDNKDNKLISKLYVPFPLKTMIKEIILGTKIGNKNEYIPYIYRKLALIYDKVDVVKISKSSIDYR